MSSIEITVKTPSENFEALIRVLRFSASVCGIDLLRPNYRMNWITYTLFTSIVGYYAFVFYTIALNYQEDWTIFLRASVTLGSSFQGVSKLITFISNKDVVMGLYQLLSGIYRDYGRMRGRYSAALDASLDKTKMGMYLLMLLYIIGYVGIVAMPYVWLFVTGQRFLVIDFQVPGLDLGTDFGYYATLGFQTILVVTFSFGLYCGDLMPLVYLLQSFMFSYIFAAKIECVNEMIVDPRNNKKSSVTAALKDIAKWHQLFSEFTDNCNNLFYYVITVQIMTSFCSTVLSVYLVMTGAWPGAYTYVITAFSSLYLYCILGTENGRANEKFEHDMYNIHWYKMTVQQQRIVLLILNKTQNPKTIDVAGVMPLSVSTALHITKTIYSITMCMIQFLIE